MNREEKIDAIIEFLDENNINIIDTSNIGAVVLEADFYLDPDNEDNEYDELTDKGLTQEDISDFSKFLEESQLTMIKTDNVQGVSFENVEYDSSNLIESTLFEGDGIEEEKESEDESGVE